MNHISSVGGLERGPRRGLFLAILIALVGSVLAGCVPITPEENGAPQLFPCHKFEFAHWREFRFGLKNSTDDMIAPVKRLYGIDRDQIKVETYPDGQIHKVHWADNNANYFAEFVVGGAFDGLEVHWEHERPTLAQVTDCLGPTRFADYTHKGETHRVWSDDELGASRYPGQVTMLLVAAISSPGSESTLQSVQQEQRVKQLFITAFTFSQQIIKNPKPFPCAKFAVSRWREFQFGVDSVAEVYDAVIRLWGSDKGEISFGKTADGKDQFLKWNDAGEEIYYDALFAGEGQLDTIQVQFFPVPTLGQVIDCLGHPDYYVATGGPQPQATTLQLWYVEQGFVARGNVFHSGFDSLWQEPLKTIPSGFGMDYFFIFPAGIEQMAQRFGYTDKDGNPILCVFKPWPGSIEAIEISEEPFFACHHSNSD